MTLLTLPGADLRVSPICYGTADWGSKAKPADAERLYAAYRAAGGNCFDTAHCYAFWADQLGTPERLLGEFVRRHDKREDVVVCTKGCHITGGAKYERPARYMSPDLLDHDLRDSRERLGLEYVDLYYLHRDDPAVPVDEIMDALNRHVAAGAIRHIAASNWRAARIEQANAYAARKGLRPFVASQVLWNLAQLGHAMPADMCVMDDAEQAWYERAKLPVFGFSPSANGYFSEGPELRGKGYDTPTSRARKERCRTIAREQGVTALQVALAYLMYQPFIGIPISGTTNAEHLTEVLGAADVRLTPEQARWLKTD